MTDDLTEDLKRLASCGHRTALDSSSPIVRSIRSRRALGAGCVASRSRVS
jgi:hypothetical protein